MTASTAFAESEIIKITNTPTDSTSPSIAVSGHDIYLVWAEISKDGSYDLFFSKSNDGGDSFSDPKKVENQKGNPISPMIVTNGETIFLTWTYRYPDSYFGGRSDDNSEIFFSKSIDGGNTFSEPRLISDKETFSSVSKIAVDGENVFITWFTHSVPWKDSFKSPQEIFLSKSIDGGETFSEPANLSNNEGFSQMPKIAVDGSNVFLVWQDESMDKPRIFFAKSSDGGNSFSEPQNISKDSPYPAGAYITFDDSSILVTWTSHKEGKYPDIFFSKSTDGGNNFSDPKNISNTPGYSILSPIVTDRKNIFVAWGDSKSNSRSILLTNSTDGGETFSKPKTISNTGVSDSPSIAYDGDSLYVTWSNQKELFKDPLEIYFLKISPSRLTGIETTVDQVEKVHDFDKNNQSADIQTNPDVISDSSTKNPKWPDENSADYSTGPGEEIQECPNDNVKKILGEDPVITPFLQNNSSATNQTYQTVDESGNPYTRSEFYHNGLSLSVAIYETKNQKNCFAVKSYDVSYDIPTQGLGIGLTSTTHFESDQLRKAILAVKDLTNPHKQMKKGIPLYEIKCKEGLNPIVRRDKVKPACVTDNTWNELLMRGWTPLRLGMPAETNILITYNATMAYPQKITKEYDPRSPFFNMVFWVNNDIVPHTVMAQDGSWSTGEINSGGVGSMKFNHTGSFKYYILEKPQTSGIIKFEKTDQDTISKVTILDGAAIPESNSLEPQELRVVIGYNNTVTWINKDSIVHTMVGGENENLWSTKVIKPGESSSVTFSNPGIFAYHGEPGPWISGTVIVLPKNYDENNLPSSGDYDFERMHMTNPCTTGQSFCSGVFENSTQIMIQCDFPVHGCPAINFENYTEAENTEPEERFPGTIKLEGDMAQKICEVIGGDCLPYYLGNPQPDGSLMVGFTVSDTVTEKQFIFLIKDGVLSYNVTEHEN